MVNYATDLQFLFQSDTAQKPYDVDNILFQIISESGFQSIFNIQDYLKNVSFVEVFKQKAVDVRRFIGIAEPGEGPILSDQLSTIREPESTQDFTEDAYENDVDIKITNGSTLNDSTYKAILDNIKSNVMTEDITKDHMKFRNFILDTVEDTVRYKFINTIEKLKEGFYTLPNEDKRQALAEPVSQLPSKQKIERLMQNLREACVLSVKEILDSDQTLIRGHFTSDPIIKARFHYNLRTNIIKLLDVKSFTNEPDPNKVLYYKKILVSAYIKSCQPFVSILVMQAMLEWYALHGDYVNVRIIVLSMTYCVFYILKSLYAMDTANQSSLINTDHKRALNAILNSLVAYINNNNKIKVDSTSTANDEMKKLVIELHNLSRDVTDTNSHIQYLKNQIKENQLAMRNILFHIEVKRKEYKWAHTEFLTVLVILVLFTIANVVLLIMKLPIIVYFSSGIIGISVVIYLLVMIVINLINGGNK